MFNGTFPYFCCERLDDGTECKANIDLAFMDPQSGLYHWRSAGFVAFQENSCRPCEVDESDSRFPVSPNAVIDVEDVVVAKNPSKRPIVSFRSRDSFVTVSGFSQNGLYLFRVVVRLPACYPRAARFGDDHGRGERCFGWVGAQGNDHRHQRLQLELVG